SDSPLGRCRGSAGDQSLPAREPEDASDETHQGSGSEVESPEMPVSLGHESQGFVVESRVRREPTHHASREENAEGRRDQRRVEADMHDETDQIRSGHVHRQGAVREGGSEEDQGRLRDQIARAATQRASQADPRQPIHPVSPIWEAPGFGTRASPYGASSRRSHRPPNGGGYRRTPPPSRYSITLERPASGVNRDWAMAYHASPTRAVLKRPQIPLSTPARDVGERRSDLRIDRKPPLHAQTTHSRRVMPSRQPAT